MEVERRLQVSFPLPPTLNHLYPSSKSGRRYLHKDARAYKDMVKKKLMVMQARKRCPKPPFSLYLHLTFPNDSRKRDASNHVKLVEDAVLNYLGHDDSLVFDLHVFKYVSSKDAGVAVELRHTTRALEV